MDEQTNEADLKGEPADEADLKGEPADEATSDEPVDEATSDEPVDEADLKGEPADEATSDEQTDEATSDEPVDEATALKKVVLKQQAKDIAVALNETEYAPLNQIKRALEVMGYDSVQELVDRAIELHKNEGMMTNKGDRLRTVGGIFFKILKKTATSEELKDIFTYLRKVNRKNKNNQANNKGYVVKTATFEELKQIIIELFDDEKKGEADTVKMTIVGRPGKVVEKGSVALTSMKGSSPKNLSKALPNPPDETQVYVIYITMKQWKKVKLSINKNPDDKLIVEGYPIFDKRIGQNGAMTLYAQSVKSKLMEQAKREKQKASSAEATT